MLSWRLQRWERNPRAPDSAVVSSLAWRRVWADLSRGSLVKPRQQADGALRGLEEQSAVSTLLSRDTLLKRTPSRLQRGGSRLTTSYYIKLSNKYAALGCASLFFCSITQACVRKKSERPYRWFVSIFRTVFSAISPLRY